MKKNKKIYSNRKEILDYQYSCWDMSCRAGCMFFSANADKEKEEADLLDTVNYVKVQCSTSYTL